MQRAAASAQEGGGGGGDLSILPKKEEVLLWKGKGLGGYVANRKRDNIIGMGIVDRVKVRRRRNSSMNTYLNLNECIIKKNSIDISAENEKLRMP
jgi:hypothetical protein